MTETTKIDEIKSQLSSLRSRITEEDRMAVALNMKCSTRTIIRYTNGQVKKEAFGLELLAALKSRIAEREKALA